MYITNTNTGSTTNTNIKHTQPSNYSIINRYSRNNSQWSHHANKKLNPNYLLYEIPEQYTSSNNSNTKKTQSTQSESLFKNNYQISFNKNKKSTFDEFNNVSTRKDSKSSMSPGSQVFNLGSRGSITNSDDNSTLVNSSISRSKVDSSSTKSLLDLVSEYENVSTKSEDNNTHKQLRINQKLNILKQNHDKNFLKGIKNTEYFYSDIKFINDEINHQFNNMKVLRAKDISNVKNCNNLFIYDKYLDVIISNNIHKDEQKLYIKKPNDVITNDQLDDIIERAWENAENSTNYLPKLITKK
ncbi:uncharacterized protein HGUI_01140 [Hanseniaspora guilliermondii]|uniref:Uncharacterized protein n=1 Tax=Hanseniaspora guilliermondii TaxID=56406 RepID=A0A1L0AZI8_9ASCO|nr:uncharacterized protein HGUI_01140 [Hanseniaspora guilliermondii]